MHYNVSRPSTLTTITPSISMTMPRRTSLLAVVFVAILAAGCGSTGAFNAATVTDVQLSEDNYEVVATNVKGEATAGYILGLSGNASRQMRTLALARVSGSGQLYGDALDDLWAQFEAEHGDVDGAPLALTNVRYDTDALNLILYTRPTVSVRADVIRFSD